VEALERATSPRPEVLHSVAEAVERQGRGYRVRVKGEWLEADHVVLACQAYQAGALAVGVDPELAELLDSVPYSSSMIVSLGFEKAGFSHPLGGFGFLVPKRERRRLVACTWVGTKFSHRVPERMALLRCFLGGENHSMLNEPDETVITWMCGELREMMGVTATPVFARVARWPRSMAQYTVGHQERVARTEARLRQTPGLFLAGNAYQGIGVPDCVRMGKQAAERITARQ
jgi:oxygen-dependent protoporphyrinogen oxidase